MENQIELNCVKSLDQFISFIDSVISENIF